MVIISIIGIIALLIGLVIYIEYRNEKKYQEEQRKRQEARKKKISPKVTKRSPAQATRTATPSEVQEYAQKPKTKPQPVQKKSPQKPAAPTVRTKTQKPSENIIPIKENKQADHISKSPTSNKAESAPKENIYPLKEDKEDRLSVRQTRAQTKPKSTPEKQKVQPQKSVNKQSTPQPPQTEKPASTLPKGDYPDFNYARLLEMGLSKEDAEEFVQELIPQIEAQIPLLQKAMDDRKYEEMERLTHSIKGSSSTVGTGGIADLLVEYNTYLKKGKEGEVIRTYQKHLLHYFEKLKKQFPPKTAKN